MILECLATLAFLCGLGLFWFWFWFWEGIRQANETLKAAEEGLRRFEEQKQQQQWDRQTLESMYWQTVGDLERIAKLK
jgi:hypothetical protein